MESAITIRNPTSWVPHIYHRSIQCSSTVITSTGISCTNLQKPCLRNLGHVRLKQHWKGTRRKSTLVHAVAAPVAPPSAYPPVDNTEHLKQLAQTYGFQQIGEPLPDDVTPEDIMASLPKEVFEINGLKVWRSVLISVTSYALGIFMIAKAPWYLLPLTWTWTGASLGGLFVIGHDCGHNSFTKNKLLDDIIGTIALMPLIYPYEPWRLLHKKHHKKTNMLHEDPTWPPILKEDLESSPPILRKAQVYGYGPLRIFWSIGYWLKFHFDLKRLRKSEVTNASISIAAVFAFMVIGWPLIIYKTGIVGWIKFWLMPWMGFHFWLSTFSMVHHTAPHIPLKNSKEWNAAQAQLNGTVHCNYPRWVEVLAHDSNAHIPHHISPKIPSYNLRVAQESLNENWGKYLNKATWNWRLMKTIMTTCHVYDKDENYVSFEKVIPEDSQPISFLRKLMPDYA